MYVCTYMYSIAEKHYEFSYLVYLEEKSLANGLEDSINLREKTLTICKQFTKFTNILFPVRSFMFYMAHKCNMYAYQLSFAYENIHVKSIYPLAQFTLDAIVLMLQILSC